MDQKFHAAILAREKNRALLAAEMAKEDYGNDLGIRIYKAIRLLVLFAVAFFAYKKFYDPTLALLNSNSERAEMLELLKKEVGQAKNQFSDGKVGFIGAAAPKPNPKANDNRKAAYDWRSDSPKNAEKIKSTYA